MRRDPGLAVLAAALVVLLGLLYSHGERFTSDGVDHYVYLRSLAVDHDLDLANDYEIVSPRRTSVEPPTRLGRTRNVHPLGPAILWAPFYAAADLVTRLRGQPADGWNPLYRDAVAVGSLLYGWAGLGLALAVARGAELSRRHPLALPSLVVLAFVGFNLLVAAQHKSGVLSYSDPVSFEEMGRGAVSAVDRAVGSPFSLPGALLAWLRTGRAPADYESLYMRRPHARWTLRMGEGDRLFLEDGWGPPRAEEGTAFRSIVRDSAGLVAPLHRPAPYLVGVRWRSRPPLRGRVVVNGQVVGSCELGPAFQDCSFDVPEEHLVAGRNSVRLRVVGEGVVEVAGVWMEPAP